MSFPKPSFRASSKSKYIPIFILGLVTVFGHPARADNAQTTPSTAGRINIMEENDYFASHDDKDYTQGARVSYLTGPVTPDGTWDQPFGFFNNTFSIFGGGDRQRRYEWTIFGQSLFTPTNLDRTVPNPHDRPYAGWLYTGGSLLQETNQGSYHTLENAELLMGVVGPAALGSLTQNDFHQLIGDSPSLGWEDQLKNEPGFIASYERKWRFQEPLVDHLMVDAIPELGGSGGNVLTYGEASTMVRFGKNLAADYGSDRIRPGLSGTGWFDPAQMEGDLGWYLFLGSQGRVVGRNIFLDGNTFADSPSVEHRIFVEDFMTGASVFWSSNVRVDFTITERTKEFYGQTGSPTRFGGLNLAFQI